ncbi:restriction endonuclease [Aeromonas veronii]
MAKKGTEFELFVKAIYEEILEQDAIENIRVEHDVKVRGKSGQAHQIDVYWEFSSAGVTHKVAVECKEYKSTVSVGKIRDFSAALEDIGNIQGIFVTTQGYQQGAITFAEHKGISLKVVKEPTQEDIDAHQGIKTIYLNINAICIGNVKMVPELDVQWVIDNTDINEGESFSFNALNNEVKVIDSNFNLLGTILDFENKLPREPENTEGLTYKYDFNDVFIHIPNSSYPPLKLKTLHFKYDTYTLSSESEIKFNMMAEAVLKDIITGDFHLYNKQRAD